MDTQSAKYLADRLQNTIVGGWQVHSYVGNGKSAVVLKAERGGQVGALKVFDPALIEQYGRDRQKARILRELELVDKSHPNLVRILDGGECPTSGYLFVVMEYLEWPDLEKVILHVPPANIRTLIGQVAAAARFLESLGMVHRDIKPSNIAVQTDFSQAKLLDLGVLRPIASSSLTDQSGDRPFVGTLRYSPPEFLLREEKDNIDGWRAITFYQLGAVLHDMIMRTPIFSQYTNPFPRLLAAVQSEVPQIDNREVPSDLVLLAKNCLIKDPVLRGRLVRWDQFAGAPITSTKLQDAKARILSRQAHAEALHAQPGVVEEENQRRELRRKIVEVQNCLQTHIRHECVGSGNFPPLTLRDIDGCAPGCGQFALSFPPSNNLGLASFLTIFFQVTVLDAASVAIQLDAAAVLMRNEFAEGTATVIPFKTVAQTVFDPIEISQIADKILYLFLDMAMTAMLSESQESQWLVLTE